MTLTLIHRYVFDLDGWQIRHPPKGLEKIDKRAAELAEAVKMRAKAAMRESQEDAYNAYSGKFLSRKQGTNRNEADDAQI